MSPPSPCIHLDKLDEEYPRDRVLTADEIGILWHGLDRNDLPWDRTTRLAIKFALVTCYVLASYLASTATN
jgi:hypothetical protein